jgi:hypothetical protein
MFCSTEEWSARPHARLPERGYSLRRPASVCTPLPLGVARNNLRGWTDEVQPVREVRPMTAKDYIDTKGYWISPDRKIRRMGDEDGEQEVIVKKTGACSEAEWRLVCEAPDVGQAECVHPDPTSISRRS